MKTAILLIALGLLLYRIPVRLEDKIPVVAYHYLATPQEIEQYEGSRLRYTVTTEDFEKHLQYLAEHGFHTISPEQLMAFSRLTGRAGEAPADLPPKPIIITFDDGTADFYNYAYPLLKRYGMSAYVFLIAAKENAPGYISNEQAREMAGSGMYIGSHSLTHRSLTEISEEELEKELFLSKELLENRLALRVDLFSIPLGVYNERVLLAAQRAGYRAIFTSDYDVFSFRNGDLSKIQRLAVKVEDKSLRTKLTIGSVMMGKLYYGLTGLFKSMLGFQRYQELRKTVIGFLDMIVTVEQSRAAGSWKLN